jgi:hypothetical protein
MQQIPPTSHRDAGRSVTLGILASARWTIRTDNAPLIPHPAFSPIIADPTVVSPEDSPDGLWYLFAHSAWGIHLYLSTDGIAWRDRGVVILDAMRSFLHHDDDGWSIVYERYPRLALALTALWARTWRSWIELRRSPDLRQWGPPIALLNPSLPWHEAAGLGKAVGNPCLVKAGGTYRLYYSASLVRIPDCGFNEPQSIGVAEAKRLEGPYIPNPEPMLGVDPGDRWANLSRGAIRLIKVDDGWAGFENGIYMDRDTGKSGSAILLLGSADGLSWRRLVEEPIVRPTAGWMRSHVYAACPVPRPDGSIRLYFNARNDWTLSRGVEGIGLAEGAPTAGP